MCVSRDPVGERGVTVGRYEPGRSHCGRPVRLTSRLALLEVVRAGLCAGSRPLAPALRAREGPEALRRSFGAAGDTSAESVRLLALLANI